MDFFRYQCKGQAQRVCAYEIVGGVILYATGSSATEARRQQSDACRLTLWTQADPRIDIAEDLVTEAQAVDAAARRELRQRVRAGQIVRGGAA